MDGKDVFQLFFHGGVRIIMQRLLEPLVRILAVVKGYPMYTLDMRL